MFDDYFDLDGLEGGVQIPISIPLDDDGYFDRLCPNDECCHEFKVLFDDWRDKVPDDAAYCPVCGKTSEPTSYNTPDLDRYIQEVGMAYVSGALEKTMRKMARDFNRSQTKGGFISMSMDYRPGVVPVAVPTEAAEQMRQRFTCEKCECHYASIGAAFFCPACGHNSAKSTFDQTLEIVRRGLLGLGVVEAAVLTGQGKDAARDFIRETLEGQLGRVVGAFQRLAESMFDELPNRASFRPRRNVFQNLEESSDLWEQAGKRRYEVVLGTPDYARLTTLFQRRHIIEHREGIVDQAYIDKSGDSSYKSGERLVVGKSDIEDAAQLVERLAIELRK